MKGEIKGDKTDKSGKKTIDRDGNEKKLQAVEGKKEGNKTFHHN
jgi:hypothetical protein